MAVHPVLFLFVGGLLSSEAGSQVKAHTTDSIGFEGSVAVPGGKASVKATGLHGGAIVAGLALTLELIFLKPHENSQHFVLTLVTGVAVGALFSALVWKGRLDDALREKENYRAEVNRIAQEKSDLENWLLQDRLSSDPPPRGGQGARKKAKR